MRVAFVPRSVEIKPPFWRFVTNFFHSFLLFFLFSLDSSELSLSICLSPVPLSIPTLLLEKTTAEVARCGAVWEESVWEMGMMLVAFSFGSLLLSNSSLIGKWFGLIVKWDSSLFFSDYLETEWLRGNLSQPWCTCVTPPMSFFHSFILFIFFCLAPALLLLSHWAHRIRGVPFNKQVKWERSNVHSARAAPQAKNFLKKKEKQKKK